MTEYQWPILALIFTATAAVAFLALAAVSLFRRDDDDPESLDPVPRLFGPLTPLIAGFLPSTRGGREAVRKDLVRAGYFEPVAVVNFLAIRSLLTYLPLIGGEVGAVLTEGKIAVAFFATGAVFGLLGYAIPRILLGVRAASRTEEIRRGLPLLMDTLGLTLSTGASLPEALASSGEAIRRG